MRQAILGRVEGHADMWLKGCAGQTRQRSPDLIYISSVQRSCLTFLSTYFHLAIIFFFLFSNPNCFISFAFICTFVYFFSSVHVYELIKVTGYFLLRQRCNIPPFKTSKYFISTIIIFIYFFKPFVHAYKLISMTVY